MGSRPTEKSWILDTLQIKRTHLHLKEIRVERMVELKHENYGVSINCRFEHRK